MTRINWSVIGLAALLAALNATVYRQGSQTEILITLVISLVVVLAKLYMLDRHYMRQFATYHLIDSLDRALVIAYQDITSGPVDILPYQNWKEDYKREVSRSDEDWIKCATKGRLPLMGRPGFQISDAAAKRIRSEVERAWSRHFGPR